MSKVEFILTVKRDGVEVAESLLGFNLVEAIAGMISDHPSQAPILELLSEHPAALVRRRIAGHDNLTETAVTNLIGDPDVDVRRGLVQSTMFRLCVSRQELSRLIHEDVELAVAVANYIEDFGNVDPDELSDDLIAHADPQVRGTVAKAYRAPRKALKRLLTDPDEEVQLAAREGLGSP